MITVMIMEPCCEKTEPGYDPGPRPAWNRTPGGWPPRCLHGEHRVPTFTAHETREQAAGEYAKTRGWGVLDGWLFEGDMPPEGERFRLLPVTGGGGSDFHRHGVPLGIPFPTVEMAREYAERKRSSLLNVIGDRDTVVRWSSYGVKPGTKLHPGDPA